MKYLKLSCVAMIIALTILAQSALCTHSRSRSRMRKTEFEVTALKTDKITKVPRNVRTPLNFNLKLPTDANMYFQGWMRYYHYNEMISSYIDKPKLFFQNSRYYNQRIKRPKHRTKDDHGHRAIANKAAFFAILYNNTFGIFDGRDDVLSRQVDSLPIEYLEDIPEDDILKGSVRNMGDFPTGSCVELRAGIPNGYKGPKIRNYWYVCFDETDVKAKFMKTLIKLKVRHQRAKSPIPVTKHSILMNGKNPMSAAMHKPGHGVKEDKSVKDGYWILLQDWTDCTLKCGGGKSYQHWMCFPPKNGGKECEGKAIRTKPCNTNPCPSAKKLLEQQLLLRNLQKEVRKPLMQVGRYSLRPQKFSKCLMKENDAFLTTFDRFGQVASKLPIRILMNNQTISVYQDDEYEDMMFSFELQKTNFIQSKEFCCFSLQDNIRQNTFCGYPENCGVDKTKNQWATQWQKDWYLFRVVCKTGRESSMLTENDLKGLDNPDNDDPNGISLDDVNRRKKQIRDQLYEEKANLFKKGIAQTQEVGFKAIARELSIENMVKKEEQNKEDGELRELEKKVKKEQKKAQCIHKNIEEKDYDDSYEDKLDAEEEMDRLKLKINQKVLDSRNRIKKLIANMRKKSQRRKDQLNDKLKEIRSNMAKEILLANKEGDIRNCIKGKKNIDFRENYCNKNFVDDYVSNSACKSNEEFCYTCCEHEFGSTYRGKRNFCYRMCDRRDPTKKKVMQQKYGGSAPKEQFAWLWASTHKVVNPEETTSSR